MVTRIPKITHAEFLQSTPVFGQTYLLNSAPLFTAILCVFLLSGPLKLILAAFSIQTPLDLTLFSAIALVPFLIVGNKLCNKELGALSLLVVFMTYYTARSLSENSGLYAQEKLLYSFLNLFTVSVILRQRSFHIKTALWVFSAIGGLFFILVLWSVRISFLEGFNSVLPVANATEVLSEFRGGYLTCALIITIASFLYQQSFPNRSFTLNRVVVGVGCFLIGARGPLVFFIVVLILMFLRQSFQSTRKSALKYTVNGLVMVGMLLLLLLTFQEDNKILELIMPSVQRFSNLTSFTGESIDVRVDQLNFVYEQALFFENVLLGHGTGSFGVLYAQADTRMYPHNFLAEVFFETGLIGLFMLVLFLFLCFGGGPGKNYFWWIALLIFLNAMKTYAFEDLRLLFAFLTLTLLSRPVTTSHERL